jgi:hypothetical protein
VKIMSMLALAIALSGCIVVRYKDGSRPSKPTIEEREVCSAESISMRAAHLVNAWR